MLQFVAALASQSAGVSYVIIYDRDQANQMTNKLSEMHSIILK